MTYEVTSYIEIPEIDGGDENIVSRNIPPIKGYIRGKRPKNTFTQSRSSTKDDIIDTDGEGDKGSDTSLDVSDPLNVPGTYIDIGGKREEDEIEMETQLISEMEPYQKGSLRDIRDKLTSSLAHTSSRNPMTWKGIPFPVSLSATEKFFRNADTNIWFPLIDSLLILTKDNSVQLFISIISKIRSFFIHEVGPKGWRFWPIADKTLTYINELEIKMRILSPDSEEFNKLYYELFYLIIGLVNLVLETPKQRICDDLIGAYSWGYKDKKVRDIVMEKRIPFVEKNYNFLEEVSSGGVSPKTKVKLSLDSEANTLISNMIYSIEQESVTFVYFLLDIIERFPNLKIITWSVTRVRKEVKKETITFIYDILPKLADFFEIPKDLFKIFHNITDTWLNMSEKKEDKICIIINMILALIYWEEFIEPYKDDFISTIRTPFEVVDKILDTIYEDQPEYPGYVYDFTTKEGKNKTIIDTVIEEEIVDPDFSYMIEERRVRQIYAAISIGFPELVDMILNDEPFGKIMEVYEDIFEKEGDKRAQDIFFDDVLNSSKEETDVKKISKPRTKEPMTKSIVLKSIKIGRQEKIPNPKHYHESRKYKFRVRAELTTNANQQSRYYATTNDGFAVIVTGPFLDYRPIYIAEFFDTIRKKFSQNIHKINIKKLVPFQEILSLDKSTRLNISVSDSLYPFIIIEDMCLKSISALKTILPKKAQGGKEILDITSTKCRIWNWSHSPVLWKQFIIAILFRIVFGIGELNERSYEIVGGAVYTSRVESVGQYTDYGKIWGDNFSIFIRQLNFHWQDVTVVISKWVTIWEGVKDTIDLDIFPSELTMWITERIHNLLDLKMIVTMM